MTEEKKVEGKAPEEKSEETKLKKEEKAGGKAESKEYIIPLREKCRVVPRYKKTPKAIRTIKEFLVRHMKIYDRDLNKIKLDTYLNEFLWARGIKRPPAKVKVKATKEGELVRVELVVFSKKLAGKKKREEKMNKLAEERAGKKKAAKKDEPEPEEKSEEDKNKEKEKQASVVEAGKEMEKAAAKKMKHETKSRAKEPKRQKRVALQK